MIRWNSYERVRALAHVAVWIVMRRINWIIAGSTSAPENLFIRCPALISPQPKSGIGLSFRLELELLHSYSYRILLVSGCRVGSGDACLMQLPDLPIDRWISAHERSNVSSRVQFSLLSPVA